MAKVLRVGSQGDEVMDLQEGLAALSIECDVDGIFGPKTERAVKHFQAAYGLEADGLAGPKTLALLEEEVAKIEAAQAGEQSNA
jgi:peptidoglycan hydrolase-like protein with peptidoglycan-binding domain